MNIKIFNIALIVGWLMVLTGGVVINPGWGIALSGALLLLMTMASAYIAGLQPAPPTDAQGPG